MFAKGLVVALLVLFSVGAAMWALRRGGDVGAVVEILVALAVALPVFALATFVLRPHGFEDSMDTLRRGLRGRWSRLRR